MNKVLFVAYQFPPKSGPGVHRSNKFARKLPDYGYFPHVLTIQKEDVLKAGGGIDETLLEGMPTEVVIHTVSPKTKLNSFRKFAMKLSIFRLFWYFLYPLFWEMSAIWPFSAYRKAEKIVIDNDIKIVYTSSAPFSSWILGFLLKKRLGIKWVADIRDPFTDGYMWLFPSYFHWKLARYFEKKILSYADKVVVNTPEVEKLYIARGICSQEKITHITNGF